MWINAIIVGCGLLIAAALGQLRNVLTLISFFTVLFTKQIPRSLVDMIAMTYRYEWRATSYALFLREDYPPFDFLGGSPAALRARRRGTGRSGDLKEEHAGVWFEGWSDPSGVSDR